MIVVWIYLAIAVLAASHRTAAIGADWEEYRRKTGLIVADHGDPELDTIFRAISKSRIRYCLIMGFAWPVLLGTSILRGGRR